MTRFQWKITNHFCKFYPTGSQKLTYSMFLLILRRTIVEISRVKQEHICQIGPIIISNRKTTADRKTRHGTTGNPLTKAITITHSAVSLAWLVVSEELVIYYARGFERWSIAEARRARAVRNPHLAAMSMEVEVLRNRLFMIRVSLEVSGLLQTRRDTKKKVRELKCSVWLNCTAAEMKKVNEVLEVVKVFRRLYTLFTSTPIDIRISMQSRGRQHILLYICPDVIARFWRNRLMCILV